MKRIAAFIALGALSSVNAIAANTNVSCQWLERAELTEFGVTETTPFTDSAFDWSEIPLETPNSKVISQLCTVNFTSSSGGRAAVILSVDRFEGRVTKEQVGNWMKSTAGQTEANVE